MKISSKVLIQSSLKLAKSAKAKAIFILLDAMDSVSALSDLTSKDFKIVPVTCRGPDESLEHFPEELGKMLEGAIHIPRIDMTRMGTIKISVLLALSKKVIAPGDKVVFLTGSPQLATLDSLILLDTGRETEILTGQTIGEIAEHVKPAVFQEVLSFAVELAGRGKEGKPIGTIFVLGDEEKVMPLSKQMIINPFKGYTEEERNILNPALRETLREFSAIDGAFIIAGDGRVLTAGRYLSASGHEEGIPQGLGARHMASAGITSLTKAVAIVISESTGTVRIFKSGKVFMEIEKPSRGSR